MYLFIFVAREYDGLWHQVEANSLYKYLGTYVSAINCEKCKYSYLLPENTMDYDTKWKCLDCDNTILNEVKYYWL